MAYTKKNADSETHIVETKVEKKKFNPKDKRIALALPDAEN